MARFFCIILASILMLGNNGYQPNFQADQYLGKWYEMARSKSIPFEKGDDSTAEYGKLDNNKISVVNTEYLPDGTKNWVSGYAVPAGDNPAHLLVSFSKNWFTKWFKGDYRVMETNYNEYSIVYSESTILWFWTIKYAWILSRDPHMSQNRVTELLNRLQQLTGVDPDSMRRTSHNRSANVNQSEPGLVKALNE